MTSPNSGPTDPFTQYSNAKPFFNANIPPWLGSNADDADRVRAYIFYERLYWNVPQTLKMVQRGADGDAMPVYIPAPRKMVEACNRFLAVDWTYDVDASAGAPDDRVDAGNLFKQLFVNQEMPSKFNRQKRYGLIRGDAVWHILGNEKHPAGQRIQIHEVDPTNAFAILKDQNPELVIGWHLIDLVPDPRDPVKQVVRRQTYRKVTGDAFGPSPITSELGIYELGKWDDRVAETNPTPQVEQIKWDGTVPPFTLNNAITNLPVYLIANQKQPCQTYGSSEVRGFESIFASVNQVATDQDLTLAMQGLGVYTSTAGPPVNADGSPGVFNLGPGEVVEVPSNATFTRVSGVQAGLPGIEHMNFILGQSQSSAGIPDIAAGIVDVTIAQSGIALQLQLSPLLSKNKEKETDMMAKYNIMFSDLLNGWMVAFEAFPNGSGVIVTATVQNPVPQDNAARFTQIIEMVTSVPPVMSVKTAQKELNKIGWDIPASELTQLQTEAQERASTAQTADPFAQRSQQEGGTPPGAPAGEVNGKPGVPVPTAA